MEITEADVGPEIYSLVQQAIAQRATIDNVVLSAADLIQNARQELTDGSLFLARLSQQVEAEMRRTRAEAINGMTFELACVMESIANKDLQFQLYAIREWNTSYANALANATDRRTVLPMYVQPTVWDDFMATNNNLLTLSRSGGFPFLKKLELHV